MYYSTPLGESKIVGMTCSASGLSIRQATAGDATILSVLSLQLGYSVSPEQVRLRLERIGEEQNHQVFVAILSNRAVGWAEVYVRTILVDESVTEIEGLVVDENVRGQGIGQSMMAFVESWARERGCSHIYLRSNVIREAAHRFYEGLGFQHIKTQKAFRKEL